MMDDERDIEAPLKVPKPEEPATTPPVGVPPVAATPAAAPAPEDDMADTSDREFEFSKDLNISPVKEDSIAPISAAEIKIQPLSVKPPVTPVEFKPQVMKTIRNGEVVPMEVPAGLKAADDAAKAIAEKIRLRQEAQAAKPSLQDTLAPKVAPPPKSAIPGWQSPRAPQNLVPNMLPNMSPSGPQGPATIATPAGKIDPTFKPMRTYEGDVADVLAHRNTSATSMAVAESQRKGHGATVTSAPVEKKHTFRKLATLLLILLLLGGGSVGGYYLYSISPLANIVPITTTTPSAPAIIATDDRVDVPVDGLLPNAVIARVRAETVTPQAANTIKEIRLTKISESGAVQVAGPDMVSIMDLNVPNTLLRSLTPVWMLGTYADADGETSTFVIVTTSFFQNSFAGMLSWEATMADELRQYLYENAPAGIANTSGPATIQIVPANPLSNLEQILPGAITPVVATTTVSSSQKFVISIKTATSTATTTLAASTTPAVEKPLPPPAVIRGSFMDRIVKNKDVREFVADGGQTLFLYSFVNNKMLVIAGNEAALAEIIARLEQRSFIR